MKSERRHELQHNALLEWLLEIGEKIKPYANAILLGVVVVLAGFVALKWMSSQSAAREATAWDLVFAASGQGDTAELDQVVEEYGSTTAAQWAAVLAGDLQLSEGCQDLFTTKSTASDQLKKAEDNFGLAVNSKNDAVRQRAIYGLARTYEAKAAVDSSKESIDQAKVEYDKLVKMGPKCPFAEAAQARLNALSQKSTLEFYDAVAAWEPRPAIGATPGLGDTNIPFDQSGQGLNVGGQPESFFGDASKRIDKAMGAPSEGGTEGETKENAAETDQPDAPAMPPATGESPAEKTEKPAKEPAKPTE